MNVPSQFSKRTDYAIGESIITNIMAKTIETPSLVSLAAGFVDYETLPTELVDKTIHRIMSDRKYGQTALQYNTTRGYLPLREAIVDRMLEADASAEVPLNISPDQVIITAGSNQMLHLVGESLLNPGDIVLSCAPSYFVYLGTISNLGARAIGVEIDADGMIPEALDEELKVLKKQGELDRVKMIYITSYYDNPTGVTMSAERRAAVMDVVHQWSKNEGRPFFTLEDTAYRELRYDVPDVNSMRSFDPGGENVIVTGSFSKSFSPGVRIGWGILPKPLVGPVLAHKGGIDFGTACMNQVLMYEALSSGDFDDHVARLRESYRLKIDAAVAAVEEYLEPLGVKMLVRPTGGLYVWIVLPEGIDTGIDARLFKQAIEEGMLYVPGQYCYPREGYHVPLNVIRLSIGIANCEEISRGIKMLAEAIKKAC